MPPETAPDATVHRMEHVRLNDAHTPCALFSVCVCIIIELSVTADEVVVEGDGQWYWRVQWRWVSGRGRSYDGEVYHVRVSEKGEGGEVKWFEVRNTVSSNYQWFL